MKGRCQMNFTCQQDELARALAVVERAINHKHSLPILTCCKLTAGDDRLRISGTDLETAIEAELPAAVDKPGEICVSARELTKFVQRLPVGEMGISLDDKLLMVNSGKIRAKLPTQDTEDFPHLLQAAADAPQISISGPDFLNALKRVSIAANDNDNRLFIRSVYVHSVDGRLALAATDITRFSHEALPVEVPEMKILLPVAAAREIRSIFSNVEQITIQADGRLFAVSGGGVLFVVRQFEGIFPDYGHVFPDAYKAEMDIARSPLIQSLERASVIASYVTLQVTPGLSLLRIVAKGDSGQEYADEVSAEMTGEEGVQPFTDIARLMDYLKAIEAERVHVRFVSTTDRMLLTTDGSAYRHIILPYAKE